MDIARNNNDTKLKHNPSHKDTGKKNNQWIRVIDIKNSFFYIKTRYLLNEISNKDIFNRENDVIDYSHVTRYWIISHFLSWSYFQKNPDVLLRFLKQKEEEDAIFETQVTMFI